MKTRDPYTKFCQKIDASLRQIEKDIESIPDSDILSDVKDLTNQILRRISSHLFFSVSDKASHNSDGRQCNERRDTVNRLHSDLDTITSKIEKTRETYHIPYQNMTREELQEEEDEIASAIELLFYLSERVEEARKNLLSKKFLLDDLICKFS
jgi:hypothetical protein